MKFLTIAAVALSLAAGTAAPLAAQPGRDTAAVRARGAALPAFERMMRHRAELGLSDAQVRQLETIRQRLEAQNAPLRQQLATQSQRLRTERREQLQRMSPEARRAELRRLRAQRAGERVPADMQPVVRQMRVNIEEAMHQAQGVLTAEQRVRARELLRAERMERRPAVRRERERRPGADARPRMERERRLRENRQP
ncbi:MAG TPA: hypothetical protein VLK84_03260 [Longimicrobium sp.]|nr:hypothetical protein [Longimicrobium sp.]